ncbi:DUF3253 domain-containing protein [Henriciella sp. AS95]|uniref:DUF3253 domain-containing protein n=1 Tax=Henriciella sp. AS95 TaxID=3135782 RepID=UPI00317C30EE
MSEPERKKKKETLDDIILRLTAERGQGKTICPSEAARTFRAENWQQLMGEVRVRAIKLAHAGEITIYRKGKPADPDDFKGIYRLGLPKEG